MSSMPFHPSFGKSTSGTDRGNKGKSKPETKSPHQIPKNEQVTLTKFDRDNARRDRMEAAREERARLREERNNR